MSLYESVAFAIVGLWWGATNPLIKRGSFGIEAIENDNKFKKTLLELKFLATRWQYILPFLLNQFGSVAYVVALQKSEISTAIPITQACTFLFTTLAAVCLGEQMPSKLSILGICLIVVGMNICMLSKL